MKAILEFIKELISENIPLCINPYINIIIHSSKSQSHQLQPEYYALD